MEMALLARERTDAHSSLFSVLRNSFAGLLICFLFRPPSASELIAISTVFNCGERTQGNPCAGCSAMQRSSSNGNGRGRETSYGNGLVANSAIVPALCPTNRQTACSVGTAKCRPHCGFTQQADINAALNIRNRFIVLRYGGLMPDNPEAHANG